MSFFEARLFLKGTYEAPVQLTPTPTLTPTLALTPTLTLTPTLSLTRYSYSGSDLSSWRRTRRRAGPQCVPGWRKAPIRVRVRVRLGLRVSGRVGVRVMVSARVGVRVRVSPRLVAASRAQLAAASWRPPAAR